MKTFGTTTSSGRFAGFVFAACVLLVLRTAVHGATTGTLSGPVTIAIEGTNQTQAGDTLQWKLTLVNQASTIRTNISQFAVYSFADFVDGSAPDSQPVFTLVDRQVNTNVMSAGQTNTQQITLTPASYTGLLSSADSFRCEAIVQTEAPSNDVWAGEMMTSVVTPSPSNFLCVTPSNVVTTGATVTANVVYTNIAPIALHNFNVFISFSGSFASDGAMQTHEFNMGTVTQNQCVIVATNAVAAATGTNTIAATVEAGEMKAVSERLDVTVQSP